MEVRWPEDLPLQIVYALPLFIALSGSAQGLSGRLGDSCGRIRTMQPFLFDGVLPGSVRLEDVLI